MSTLDTLTVNNLTSHVPEHLTLSLHRHLRTSLILGDDRGAVEVSTFARSNRGTVDVHSRDPREGLEPMAHCWVLDGPCHGAGASIAPDTGPSEFRDALVAGDGPALVAAMAERHRQVFDQ